jgi:hypothetical protein
MRMPPRVSVARRRNDATMRFSNPVSEEGTQGKILQARLHAPNCHRGNKWLGDDDAIVGVVQDDGIMVGTEEPVQGGRVHRLSGARGGGEGRVERECRGLKMEGSCRYAAHVCTKVVRRKVKNFQIQNVKSLASTGSQV